ncbi:MAG: hypothetical protein WCH32_16935, partial [Pseudomonadota bacterium]
NGNATSNTPDPRPFIGLAIPAMPPSAATLKASITICRAPSGNASNAFRAGVSQDTGRVGLILFCPFRFEMLADLPTSVKRIAERFSLASRWRGHPDTPTSLLRYSPRAELVFLYAGDD